MTPLLKKVVGIVIVIIFSGVGSYIGLIVTGSESNLISIALVFVGVIVGLRFVKVLGIDLTSSGRPRSGRGATLRWGAR